MAKPTGGSAQMSQAQMNERFIKLSYEQPITASAQNGTTYATGTNLNFDFPIVAGAYATKINVAYNVSFTWTNGTGSAPTLNASSASGTAYGLFQEASVTYGNRQLTIHPYVTRPFAQTRGYNRTITGETLLNQSTSLQNSIYKAAAAPSAGSNNWIGDFDIPLNSIHPLSPYGFLPMGGSGTRGQLQLVPTTQFTGADPLLSCINLNGNTGTITNLTGTVTVTIWYRDYKSFATPAPLQLDLTNQPTAQMIRLADMNPLTAGVPNYLRIVNPYPFAKLFSIVVDGQSSSTFCSATNIQAYRIDAAENTNSGLRVYDSTNGGMNNYYKRQRFIYGQDFDDGVLAFDALVENSVSPDVQEGEAMLNLTSAGYPASRLGVQVGTVSNANGITPRVMSWGVIVNNVGIH